ncbi:folliculin [Arctopsyche grandis]|uniref:folliculin n=1 Tax=Arctopsyche grandis TaxID=121162 RepID=UPI00406D6CD4
MGWQHCNVALLFDSYDVCHGRAMNAAVCVCHFCEAHGPRVVVCTRAEGGAVEGGTVERGAASAPPCGGCAPNDPGGERLRRLSSGRLTTAADADALLAHAALRSLSCEVSSMKESALVFFGDSRGYVLSYAFQIKDTQARGLKRWFSFIVLMKDKLFLLNITPFLAKQLEETAKELQSLADVIFAKDQAVRSQRALRLMNYKTENIAPRSLIELTGKKNVFAYLHTRFSWMLNSCSKVFTETICDGLSPVSKDDIMDHNFNIQNMSLYSLETYFGKDAFLDILYCALTGLQIIVRGDHKICSDITAALVFILPHSPKSIEYSDYVPSSEAPLFFCRSDVAVPKPCSGILRIDIVNEKPVIHWLGNLPMKWPTLMINIVKGMENKFKESVLFHHIIALKEEWKNNVNTIKCLIDSASSEENISNVKTVMGIKAEDEDLIQYWLSVS